MLDQSVTASVAIAGCNCSSNQWGPEAGGIPGLEGCFGAAKKRHNLDWQDKGSQQRGRSGGREWLTGFHPTVSIGSRTAATDRLLIAGYGKSCWTAGVRQGHPGTGFNPSYQWHCPLNKGAWIQWHVSLYLRIHVHSGEHSQQAAGPE